MHLRYSWFTVPALAAVLVLSASPPASAAWPSGPDVNVAACTAPNDQGLLQTASDGSGGVILAWADTRPGAVGIYVQRITAYGTPAWPADGVRIHTPPLGVINVERRIDAGPGESNLGITSDGAGGAIVAWKDTVGPGNTDIMAQRVSRTGAILWDPAGVAVCRAEGQQLAPVVVTDGAGGAIVAWQDLRGGTLTVRAQRVTASGTCDWTADGVLASSAAESYQVPDWSWIYLGAASDEAGGAIVTWASARGIVAQRLDRNGATLWTPAGVAARPHERLEAAPSVISDGSQGAFIAWGDYWDGGAGVHAQHVDAAGNAGWGSRGETLCDASYDSWDAHLVADGQGGCIVVWQDSRPYYCAPCNGSVLYGQRLDHNGSALWASGGVMVSDATRGSAGQNMRLAPQAIPDGSGGVLLTYTLNVGGDPGCSSASLYLQRVAANGTRAWSNDVAMCCLAANQAFPVLVPSQAGEPIVAWEDRRNGNGDIYAQRVAPDGLFHAPITFTDAGAGLPIPEYNESVWGDYDNDGDLDLLCARGPNYSGPHIFRNDAGTLVDSGISFPAGASFNAIWGDFDNDGWLDVATSAAIYRNNGHGTFSALYTNPFPTMMSRVSCADYDGDGDLDLLCIGFWGTMNENPLTEIYRNDGAGQFQLVKVAVEDVMDASMSWADYDRDGRIDLLLGGQLYHNTGNANFLHVQTGLPDGTYDFGAFGDYDNDGWPDAAISRNGVYHNNHDGTFTQVSNLPYGSITWVDFDNDGRSDIVLGSESGAGTILRNEGDGVFTDIGVALPGGFARSPAVADFDKDGDADLLFGMNLYRNDGAPANTPPRMPDGPWTVEVSGGVVTLTWTPATDAQTPPSALTYNVRLGTTPGGSDIVSAMSWPLSGFRSVVQAGNAGTLTSMTLKPPLSVEHLYWSVQAVDGAYAGSPFSPERVFGPVPTLPSLYSLDAEPTAVHLVWYAAEELPGVATVYRRDMGSEWIALGPPSPDGTGYLRYEDTAVAPGARYGYRVGVANGTQQIFSEEVWADVPEAVVAFALEKVTPNPSPNGTVSVQFSLPAGPAGRLELVDVRGRRVVEQKVQGPGRFSVNLGRDRRLGSGVYFVRLVHGADVRVERAIVLQ